jgi:hypothetical protein
MARNRKKKTNEENMLDLKDESKREKTLKSISSKPFMISLSFDKWWLMTMQKLDLTPSMKIAVKKHFEARGFMKTGNFEGGLEDFGLKKA